MDVLCYKHPAAVPALVAGRTWHVRPLPQHAVEAAGEQASGLGRELSQAWSELECAVRILAAACDVQPAAIRGLHPHEAAELADRWRDVQDEATPDADALDAELTLLLFEVEPRAMMDGAVARSASSASDYYGQPMASLTTGQLVYYLLLRTAYNEIVVEGANRKVTRRWIEKLEKRAGRTCRSMT